MLLKSKVFVCVTLTICLVLYILLNNEQNFIVKLSETDTISTKGSELHQNENVILENVNEGKARPEIKSTIDKTEKETQKAQSTVNNTLTNEGFEYDESLIFDGVELITPEQLDNVFVDSSDRVYKKALEAFFLAEDFDGVLNKIGQLDQNEESIERELKLASTLNDLGGNQIQGESFTCRGKLCALTFEYSKDSAIDIDKLSEFDKNYTFQNFTETESGYTRLKMLLIQTEDPSKLSLNNS